LSSRSSVEPFFHSDTAAKFNELNTHLKHDEISSHVCLFLSLSLISSLHTLYQVNSEALLVHDLHNRDRLKQLERQDAKAAAEREAMAAAAAVASKSGGGGGGSSGGSSGGYRNAYTGNPATATTGGGGGGYSGNHGNGNDGGAFMRNTADNSSDPHAFSSSSFSIPSAALRSTYRSQQHQQQPEEKKRAANSAQNEKFNNKSSMKASPSFSLPSYAASIGRSKEGNDYDDQEIE
jgi:hypothetical protein